MNTELDWKGFLEATEHKEEGLYLVENLDDFAARYFQGHRNTALVPFDYVLDTAAWRPVLGWGFKKIIFGFHDFQRTVASVRAAVKLPIVPELMVDAKGQEIPAYKWIALKHVVMADGNSKKLIDTAYAFDRAITDPYETLKVNDDYWPHIRESVDLTTDELIIEFEAYEYKRKQIASTRVLQEARNKADEQLLNGDPLGAQATFFNGYTLSNRILQEQSKKPIQTMKEAWPDFVTQITKWRQRPIIGFETDMQMLTNSLLGLRGLILIAAEPNLGKTILVLQLAIQALQHHPDACCVFLSLEMYRDELIARAASAAINETWKSFVIEGSDEKVQRAAQGLNSIWDRLVIADRERFEGGEENIIKLMTELKERTGCKRTLIVVDYLQVMEVPVEIERQLRSETEVDRWRVEAMKRLKNSLERDDAILVISEIRKHQGKNEKLTNDDIMGSARLAYAADTILLWQNLTPLEKVQWLVLTGTGIGGRIAPTKDKPKGDDLTEQVEVLDSFCQTLNIRPAWLEITKARDGTLRKSIPITAYYNKLVIKEGFLQDGSNEQTSRKEEEADGQLDAIFVD